MGEKKVAKEAMQLDEEGADVASINVNGFLFRFRTL
jgi:hypothetical protein